MKLHLCCKKPLRLCGEKPACLRLCGEKPLRLCGEKIASLR